MTSAPRRPGTRCSYALSGDGRVFNDANGPWVSGFRGAIFGDDPDGALATAQAAIQDEIDASY